MLVFTDFISFVTKVNTVCVARSALTAAVTFTCALAQHENVSWEVTKKSFGDENTAHVGPSEVFWVHSDICFKECDGISYHKETSPYMTTND